jgi:hypothetical protein
MMMPRTEYEMSDEDLEILLDAGKPTPVMMTGGSTGSSPRENATRAWEALGKKMGFDGMSVRPISGKGQKFFSAIPSETDEAKAERLEREAAEARVAERDALQVEIARCQKRLAELDE